LFLHLTYWRVSSDISALLAGTCIVTDETKYVNNNI